MKLELRGITKRFGSLVANDHINLEVLPGQIHCLLGENGAGKSTLMNILFGLYHADEGSIVLDGVEQRFSGPGDAMRAGIGMVHQHFMLVPVFSVTENVMLGAEPTHLAGKLDLNAGRESVKKISSELGFEIDPDALVEDLPVGIQQRVEIVKALSRKAKVLVFDEPTAVLTPGETDELLALMRRLRDEGTAIVFITHKLREVLAVADKITVIRHGKVVGEASTATSKEDLAAMMVGRPVELKVQKESARPGPTALEVERMTVIDSTGKKMVDNLNFEVRCGEIVAIAGVQGNGQTELTEAIMGLRESVNSSLKINGTSIQGLNIRQISDLGVGYIPEDRHHDAIVSDFTSDENVLLNRTFDPKFVRRKTIKKDFLRKYTQGLIERFDVRGADNGAPLGKLSGGNQQKLVLARELSRDIKLFVASQPTRGIDVGSIEFVHNQIMAARDAGVGVLIISTELDEVISLADRIIVMYRGRAVGIVPGDTSREKLGMMMAGIATEEKKS